MNRIEIKTFDSIEPVDKREVLRYSKAQESSESINSTLDECIKECLPNLTYTVIYKIIDIKKDNDSIWFEDQIISSKSLSNHLNECKKVCLMFSTIGFSIDRAWHKYEKISPTKSLLISSLGSERVEALCEIFCKELSCKYTTVSRFSPGYGDLDIDLQKYFFKSLDITKNSGAILNDNMFIAPTKSVTAIIGIK